MPLWPPLPHSVTSVYSPGFDSFLSDVCTVMKTKPSIEGAVDDFDMEQVDVDVKFIQERVDNNGGDMLAAVSALIEERQKLGESVRLQEGNLKPFCNAPLYSQLCELARDGARPVLKPDFVPNGGVGEPLRPQYRVLKKAIHHQFSKLQRAHRAILLPKALLKGCAWLHLNPSHVAFKPSDLKGRICSDSSGSGLNDGTDMEAVYAELGELTLPTLAEFTELVTRARSRHHRILSKFDVEAAFHRFKLHWSLAILLAIDLDELILIPLVGVFGWNASPSFYNVISKTISWAHNGGLSPSEIDALSICQGEIPVHREEEWCEPLRLAERSSTYVDDSSLLSSEETFLMDSSDLKVIAKHLLGKTAIKDEKTEGPYHCLDVMGWSTDMEKGTVAPSHKGICKMLCYIFLISNRSITLETLESMIGTLQHYAVVLPLVAGSLGCMRSQLIAAQQAPHSPRYINLNAESMREIYLWRAMLSACLHDRSLWCCPVEFLRANPQTNREIEMFTDASYTIGGGYYIPGVAFAHWVWSEEEKLLFEEAKLHINMLELMVVVVAIWSNVTLFANASVTIHIDNSSAIAWINALRSGSPAAKPWVNLLLLLCKSYNIYITAVHIPGVDNIIADGLSRDVQEVIEHQDRNGLEDIPPMPLEFRDQLFRMPCGTDSLVDHWRTLRSILIAQGSTPLDTFVLKTISRLVSLRTLL
jgi:hypothetical protein